MGAKEIPSTARPYCTIKLLTGDTTWRHVYSCGVVSAVHERQHTAVGEVQAWVSQSPV